MEDGLVVAGVPGLVVDVTKWDCSLTRSGLACSTESSTPVKTAERPGREYESGTTRASIGINSITASTAAQAA